MSGDGSGGATRALCERLRVVAVEGDRLLVVAERAAGCLACAIREGCATAAFAALRRPQLLELDRPEGMAVDSGDEVEVEMSGNAFLAAAGLVYLLPAGALVAGVAVGTAAGLSDAGAAGLGLGALAAGFAPLLWAERRAGSVGALRVVAVHPGGR